MQIHSAVNAYRLYQIPEQKYQKCQGTDQSGFYLPETMTVEGTDAEFEIERPKGDTEEVIVDTEQLNLF